jgi:hypothetical protein
MTEDHPSVAYASVTVAWLQEQLADLGLPTDGSKRTLYDRYTAAIELPTISEESSSPSESPSGETSTEAPPTPESSPEPEPEPEPEPAPVDDASDSVENAEPATLDEPAPPANEPSAEPVASSEGTAPAAADGPAFPLPEGWFFAPIGAFAGRVGISVDGRLIAWQRQRGLHLTGRMDEPTVLDVRGLQTERGLPVNGRLDAATWDAAWA